MIDGDRLLGYEQKGQDEVELYEMDLETERGRICSGRKFPERITDGYF